MVILTQDYLKRSKHEDTNNLINTILSLEDKDVIV